jgi:hypothetical protein
MLVAVMILMVHFIDLYPTRKEVIKCDVNRDKFPFKDNFFDEVIAINFI